MYSEAMEDKRVAQPSQARKTSGVSRHRCSREWHLVPNHDTGIGV